MPTAKTILMKFEVLEFMAHTETVLHTELLRHGPVFDYEQRSVRLEDGSEASREIILHHGGVAVLALDESDRLLMVRQYRSGVGRELLELPAGKLEAGEDPADCGKRELEEECGLCTDCVTPLAVLFPTPAYCSEKITIFRAGRLTPGQVHPDEGEFVTPLWVPFSEAVRMVLSGEITDAKTQVGILKYALLQKEKEE